MINKRRVWRPVLALLVPYTAYAGYVTYRTSVEIDTRNKLFRERDTEVIGKPPKNDILLKYAPFRVLGRFENPFEEYRIQTIYEFFFNRIVELFEKNRGGIPIDQRQMDELMPVHKPTWCEDLQSSLDSNHHNASDNNGDDDVLKNTACPTVLSKIDIIPSGNETLTDLNHKNDTNTGRLPIYNTWLGQSCNYIVYNGLKILTDPIFSDHLIHEKFGPKRITSIPCPIEQLPQPDIILVSHNHPDHLDTKSLKFWANSMDTLWIVPKGMNKFMNKYNVKNYIQLSWWDTCELTTKDGHVYRITSTPAMHWSGRSIWDTNESLWCSFMLQHQNKPILFHAGDTGFVQDLCTSIRDRFGGGCQLALLPCGQYCPEWHQKPRHINPKEVLKIMKILHCENVLGIHWGTFLLSGEYFMEPKEKLELLAQFEGVGDRCFCPELGKTIKFD